MRAEHGWISCSGHVNPRQPACASCIPARSSLTSFSAARVGHGRRCRYPGGGAWLELALVLFTSQGAVATGHAATARLGSEDVRLFDEALQALLRAEVVHDVGVFGLQLAINLCERPSADRVTRAGSNLVHTVLHRTMRTEQAELPLVACANRLCRTPPWCCSATSSTGAPDGVGVLDLVTSLQSQARDHGGQVHAVLGNHEVLLLAARRFGARASGGPGGIFQGDWLANGGVASDLERLSAVHEEWMVALPAVLRSCRPRSPVSSVPIPKGLQ